MTFQQLNDKTILLVDDQPANLAVLYNHLKQANYDIVVTDNGIDAIEKAAEIAPDIVLLDIRMPGMDGYETCRAIKSNPQLVNVPVIFLSALHDTDDRLRGFEVGGVDFISKPINILEVAARVDSHIALAQMRRELQVDNDQLESTVAARTSELNAVVTDLKQEVKRRRQSESEKQQLLSLLQDQNKQLHSVTEWLLQSRNAQKIELSRLITQPLVNNVAKIVIELDSALADSVPGSEACEVSMNHVRTAQLRATQMLLFLQNLQTDKSRKPAESSRPKPSEVIKLTEREREILRYLANGESSVSIGNKLVISDATVRTYRTRIMRKLNINHVAGLVKYALLHDLTDLEV